MDILAPGCSSILTIPPPPLAPSAGGGFRERGELSTNRRAAASTDRLRQDGVCIEASGCDRAAGKNVDVAAHAKTAVRTAEVQRKSVNVGKPPLRIDDDLGGVERLVGGHCAGQAATAADALREDAVGVVAVDDEAAGVGDRDVAAAVAGAAKAALA